MPQKKGSDNYDALGSIFDFIFAEAEKKPDRRKPVKLTGIAGDSMLVDGIAASLEMPGAFISNTVVDEFNDALDLELSVSPYKGVGKLKVTSNSLIDFLKDPVAFTEKSIKTTQAIRKSMRAQFAGDAIKDVLYSGWAAKYADDEVKGIIANSIAAGNVPLSRNKEYQEKFDLRSAIGQSSAGRFTTGEREKVGSRSAELIGRRVFGTNGWETMGSQDKEGFLAAVSAMNGEEKAKDQVQTYLNSRYGAGAPAYFTRYENVLGKDALNNTMDRSLFDPKFYKELEIGEIDSKIANVRSSGVPTLADEEKVRMYEKTKLLLMKDSNAIRNNIDQIKQDLRTVTDPAYRTALEKDLKNAKSALRAINGDTFFGKIGTWEGYFNSLKNIYGGGMFVPSVLNGAFYDKNKNKLWNPVKEQSLFIKTQGFEKLEFTYFDVAEGGNGLRKTWNKMGTQVYYLTPRSIFRTLFYNGEGFQYLLGKSLNSLAAINPGQDATKWKAMLQDGFLGKDGRDFQTFKTTLLSSLSTQLSPRDFAKFQRALGSVETFKKLTTTFSLPFRIQSSLNKIFQERTKKFRVALSRKLLSNPRLRSYFAKNAAGKLLGEWIAKGGVDTFFRSIITAIASSMGMAVGPVGSFLVGVAAMVATDLMLRIGARLFNFAKYVAIGIAGLFFIILISSGVEIAKFNKTTYSANLTPPGDVLQCQLYELVPLDPNAPSPWGPAIISPPSGEECPIGTGSIRCTQGWVDNISSHTNITQLMPVDLAYTGELKAPQFCTQGDCKISSVWQIQCGGNNHAGGAVIFSASTGSVTYTFTTYHVKPVVSVGEKVMSGQTYAVVQMPPEVFDGPCWTGPHLHFEAKQDGVPVDPMELLQEFNCDVPDESGCM